MAIRLDHWMRHLALGMVLGGTALLAGCDLLDGYQEEAAATCPQGLGWAEGLTRYFDAGAELPTAFGADADDCLFHQWSWEAFSWATAMVDGKPRFLSLKTMDDLDPSPDGTPAPAGMLRLTPRSTKAHNLPVEDYDAAFVEADGSVLVGQNGYPVYASVHMNDSYFDTAKANLIENGGYQANVDTDKPGAAGADCGEIGEPEDADKAYFQCGAAVFKATWMRLKPGEAAPAGAFTTAAEVPVLKNLCTKVSCTVVATDQYEQVQVALVGLHVVGYVEHHPEFLWATFEHVNNSPAFPDGTFAFSDASNPNAFTFYAAGTPFTQDQVLVPNQPANQGDPPLLTFDEATQTFSPITQVVQMNQTGGNTEPNGPANITAVNQASQQVMQNASAWQASYFLVGTAWLEPDTYVATNPDITNTGVQWNDKAKGSVALANMTAETFMQSPGKGDTLNCFACHNPQSFYFSDHTMALRRVAISHALAVDTPFAVPNIAQGKIPADRAPQN
jgi:hypothetical protein